MTKLRCGLLGAGYQGKTHAKILAGHPLAELVAVADIKPGAAEAAAREFAPGAKVYTDGYSMIKEAGLDVMYAVIPPYGHTGEIEAAAAKGIHLFMEKPIALDSARASAMVAAVEKAGVKSQVGFHMRFYKSVQAMKAMLEDGSAGRPTLFSARYWVNMEGPDWWRDRGRSGGQVVEQVIHIYDLALHWLGRPEAVNGVVTNVVRPVVPSYTIEDTSLGLMRFPGGALAAITGSNNAVPMHFFGEFHMVCEKATFIYASTGQHWKASDQASIYYHDGSARHFTEDGNPYLSETDQFLAAVRDDKPTLSPARHGLDALRACEQVRDGNVI